MAPGPSSEYSPYDDADKGGEGEVEDEDDDELEAVEDEAIEDGVDDDNDDDGGRIGMTAGCSFCFLWPLSTLVPS